MMSGHAPQIADLLRSPDLLLYQVDFNACQALFVPMTRESYRLSSFLDARIKRPGPGGYAVNLEDLLEALEGSGAQQPRAHYLFHVGHTCSTLLSRALGELRGCLALREPMALLEVATWKRAGRAPSALAPARWASVLGAIERLLAKTYAPDELLVIKPSSFANNLMPELMRSPEQRRAVFLYSPLETFLANMLKSSDNRADGIEQLGPFLADAVTRGALGGLAMERLSDAQRVATLWVVQIQLFLDLLPTVPEGRLCSLDSEVFLAAPAPLLGAVARFLGVEATDDAIAAVTEGPTFRTYAKGPSRTYDAETRRQELARAAERHRAEIDEGLAWAREITRDRPIPPVLPRALATGHGA